MRHSHADGISVRVRLTSGALRVEVGDDGVGGADEASGSGLAGLRRRVEGGGGSFSVASSAGAGTRITAIVPTA